MAEILLVEDDKLLGESLKERLGEEGHVVTWAKTASSAIEHAKNTKYALAILDIGLPDQSGLTIGQDIKHQYGIPIIFLTAMNSAEFRLEGFEIGAEDYIPKPFHLKELLLRVSRVLERYKADSRIKVGAFELKINEVAAKLRDGKTISLSQTDFEVLRTLIEASPSAVSREEIIERVFGAGGANARSIDNCIVRLRGLLENDAEFIRSIRGVGYQWRT